MKLRRILTSSMILMSLPMVGCDAPRANNPEATQPSPSASNSARDGRNLAPGMDAYGSDPQWPFDTYRGGGGGRAR